MDFSWRLLILGWRLAIQSVEGSKRLRFPRRGLSSRLRHKLCLNLHPPGSSSSVLTCQPPHVHQILLFLSLNMCISSVLCFSGECWLIPTLQVLGAAMVSHDMSYTEWELDQKEGWVPKNWCFWTVVLEKTIDSPLNSKIKSVSFKRNQQRIFIGRTEAEAEAPMLWPPDAKTQLIGKDLDAERDRRQKEKRVAEDEMAR